MDGSAICAKIDGGEVVAHLIGAVADIASGAGSEPAANPITPALELAIVQNGACVISTRRDLDGSATRAKTDGDEAVAHMSGEVADSASGAGSEPAVSASTPALELAIVQNGACVVVTRRDLNGSAIRAKIDGGEVDAHLIGVVADNSSGARSELAVRACTPALELAIVNGACVHIACTH